MFPGNNRFLDGMHATVTGAKGIESKIPGTHALNKGQLFSGLKPFRPGFKLQKRRFNGQMFFIIIGPFFPVLIPFVVTLLEFRVKIGGRFAKLFFQFLQLFQRFPMGFFERLNLRFHRQIRRAVQMAAGGTAGTQKSFKLNGRHHIGNFTILIFRDTGRIKYIITGSHNNGPHIQFNNSVLLVKIDGISLADFGADAAFLAVQLSTVIRINGVGGRDPLGKPAVDGPAGP